jgi:hypothetical protein
MISAINYQTLIDQLFQGSEPMWEQLTGHYANINQLLIDIGAPVEGNIYSYHYANNHQFGMLEPNFFW